MKNTDNKLWILVVILLIIICIITILLNRKNSELEEKYLALEAKYSENYTNEMKIEYTEDFSKEDGSDSYARTLDHKDSPYFRHPDFYNLTSNETLSILTHFKTVQQTTEWSCGMSCVMMVLDWYGKLGNWNEETLGNLRHSLENTEIADYPGTTLKQMIDVIEGIGDLQYTSTLDNPDVTLEDFENYIKEGTPVMICWNDWGGHWEVVIGYDNMGTEDVYDDVLIVADPYDINDHNQDGYYIIPAGRFWDNYSMYGYFPETEGGNDNLFVAVKTIK